MLFCCFIYHGGLQSRSVTYVKPSSVFIAWGRTLAEPFPLGQAQSAFLPRSHVPGPYYRAEYGCVAEKKKPLATAPGNGSHALTGTGACANGFILLTVTTTGAS